MAWILLFMFILVVGLLLLVEKLLERLRLCCEELKKYESHTEALVSEHLCPKEDGVRLSGSRTTFLPEKVSTEHIDTESSSQDSEDADLRGQDRVIHDSDNEGSPPRDDG